MRSFTRIVFRSAGWESTIAPAAAWARKRAREDNASTQADDTGSAPADESPATPLPPPWLLHQRSPARWAALIHTETMPRPSPPLGCRCCCWRCGCSARCRGLCACRLTTPRCSRACRRSAAATPAPQPTEAARCMAQRPPRLAKVFGTALCRRYGRRGRSALHRYAQAAGTVVD